MKSMAELQKSFKASSVLSESVLLLVLLLWLSITVRPSMAATRIVPVGVILDLNSKLGYTVNNSLALAVEDYYSDHKDTATKIELIVRNVPQNDVVAAAEKASHLIKKEKVLAILGPQNSEQATEIVKLGEKSQVAVIWFPITGPSLLPPPSPSSDQGHNCYQFHAIADTAQALGWQSIVPIYEQTEYGSQLIPCLTDVFKDMGIRMDNVTSIDSSNSENLGLINATLDELNNMRTHAFLVHMSRDFGARFIKSAQERDMMDEGYAWILTQGLSSLTDPRVPVQRKLFYPAKTFQYFTDSVRLGRFMQGALGVRPIMNIGNKTPEGREIEKKFSARFNSLLTTYGWWAYHTIEALAMALEKPGTDNNGPTLRSKILATNFTGVSGVNFDLSKGQLHQSVLEIYNVVGDTERVIGYWSPETGLVQDYGKGGEISGEYQRKVPRWAGDTLDKLPNSRIGIPTTNYFPELLNVYSYSKVRIDGFSIDVFLKAVDVLPFPFNNYEFVPLPKMTYDDILCRQMKEKGLDAVIGDITIVANRAECVDFTLPYLDSSVAMVVKVKTSTSKWILFKPFKWSLWLILGGIFVTATMIIIILERNKTNEFRFNPFLVYKIDVTEKFASRAAGWMVILTSFLFILVVQVYTANLTSILTQGQMKGPSFKDKDEIIKGSNVSVGYRKGSWVRRFLIEQIRIKDDQLKAYTSHEEYDEALSKGTENGGVDAVFDEIPYLTLFLSKYNSRFTMTGQIYKSGGYAFAFPKKSGMTSHFSDAILKVTQDVEPYRALMAKNSLPTSIEDWEFEDQSDTEITSLKIAYFGGLYPVLLSIVALFLGLSIIDPLVIQRFREKLSR